MTQSLRHAVLSLIVCAYVMPVGAAYAQGSLGKPLTIVVPYSAGSGGDNLVRLLSPKMQERLNRPVVIENRIGASGNIGTLSVTRAEPNGDTLLLAANTIVQNVGLFRDLKYDPITSFEPVIYLGRNPMVLAVTKGLPTATLKEFIAYAKERPGRINYASPGNGTPHHLSMEMLKSMTGIELVHIPYRGLAQAHTDLLGGHISAMFAAASSIWPLWRQGEIRLLGTGSAHRDPEAPEVPTIAEQGVPGFETEAWFALFAPAGTPVSITNNYNAILNELLTELREPIAKIGITNGGGPPQRLAAMLPIDLKKWLAVIKQAGIEPQ